MTAAAAPQCAPVLLIGFNRPDEIRQVLDAISRARPARLLVAVDGPRPGVESDEVSCRAVRNLVAEIDWECRVSTRFADSNQGCRAAVPAALDWAFAQVPAAIVLEDDCVPDPTFFRFCTELLDRYAADERVMTISGHRWEEPDDPGPASYRASRYPAIWGWATWADRWKLFDLDMAEWPALRNSDWLTRRLSDPAAVAHWTRIFDDMRGGLDTWDYAWAFANWCHDALTLRSTTNLVTNIGHGPSATHTTDPEHPALTRSSAPLSFPLSHPEELVVDSAADARVEDLAHSGVERRRLRMAAGRIAARRAEVPS